MPIPLAAGLGIAKGLFGIASGIFGGGAKRRAEAKARQAQMNAELEAKKNVDLSQQGLAEAKRIAGGRMAGAGMMEQNIYGAQAGTLAGVNRNATDSSQALALAGATQGQTNAAFNNLAGMEAQNGVVQQGQVQQARAGVQNAQGNLQNMYSQQGQQAAQDATQIGMANQHNIFGGLGEIANIGIMQGMGMFGTNAPKTAQEGSQWVGPSAQQYSTGFRPTFGLPQQSRFNPFQ